MEYEGQICRAPMERGSFMLPVMVGCSYNRCRFCTLFKHLKYRMLPMEQIEAELVRVERAGGKPGVIFLGDGNAFDLPASRLFGILEMIKRHFPDCRAVHMDATVSGIGEKTDRELEQFFQMGVRHLYLGIESGLEDVLSFMEKDHSIGEACRQVERLKAAGLVYDAHIMTGVAGSGRGLENAEQLAHFLNRTGPERVINFSMFLHRDAPLYREIGRGAFLPSTELENLKEERRLLELLKPGKDTRGFLQYDGFHDYIEVRVKGTLPRDQGKMLRMLDEANARYEKEEAVGAYKEDPGWAPVLKGPDFS